MIGLLLLCLSTSSMTKAQDAQIFHHSADTPAEETADNRLNRSRSPLVEEDMEKYLDMAGIIKHWGYPVEVHDNVTTEDGYILTIFRIPHGRNQSTASNGRRPVVLLQHGLLGSSEIWVSNLPHQDAPFLYADTGFDVWLGNFRGNKHGKAHVRLSPETDKAAFWDFSWAEMAKYDLPAIINYVTEMSNSTSLYYIAHSMGTLTGFIAFSRNEELARKITKFYALSPVLKLQNIQGALRVLSLFEATINAALYYNGVEEFVMLPKWLQDLLAEHVCGNAQVDANSRLPVHLAHIPAGTSRRTISHFAQMVNSDTIADYDFGPFENQIRYGQDTPPEYDISRMQTPVGLYWGSSDWLASDRDVRDAMPKLKNIFTKSYLTDFNHIDFVWGLRAAKEIYIPIQNDIYSNFVN